MIDGSMQGRIDRFVRGEEIALSSARELVSVLVEALNEAGDRLTSSQMSLRDQFASAALVHAMTSEDGEQAARDAYRIADAMLKVRGS